MSIEYDEAKLPPHSMDAERGVLGSIMLMSSCLDEISSMVTPESFYVTAHTLIYKVLLQLHQAGTVIDAITVSEELFRRNQYSEIGGASYIATILEAVPHASHVRYYARIVAERALRRELNYLCHDAVKNVYDETIEIRDVLGKLMSRVEHMLSMSSTDARSVRDVVADLRKLQLNPPTIVSTGLKDLDFVLKGPYDINGGWKSGQLILVGARPGMGKSAIAMKFLESAAKCGVPSSIIPLEMDGEELCERIQHQGPGRLDEIAGLPIYIEDKQFELESLIGSIRLQHKRKGVRFVVIDYLTLIEVEGRMNSTEKIEKVTRRLKRLAKELKIPIVILAQLNRKLEDRPDKRPQLADIRGAGSAEQDADVVLFLYRHEVYFANEKPGQCEIIVAKQRKGQMGVTVNVGFKKESTQFVDSSELPVDVNIDGMFQHPRGYK